MAQGAVKKRPAKAADPKKSNPLAPKKGGNRVVAPKKAKLIQKQKLIKKHSAGITAMTERNLAERAGHLELLKGGKKKGGEKDKKK